MILVDKEKIIHLVTAIQYSAKNLGMSIYDVSGQIHSAGDLNDKCWQDLIDYLEGCYDIGG